MSKTAIDFFAKGLENNKTKLSVSVFDLNAKYDTKEIPFKKKVSLSHMNFNKPERKQKVEEKMKDNQHEDYSWRSKKMGSTTTSFRSTSQTPIKGNLLKFEGQPIFPPQPPQTPSKLHAQTTRQPRILKKLPAFQPQKQRYQNEEGNCYHQHIPRITEQCQNHEQSLSSSIEYHRIVGDKDAIVENVATRGGIGQANQDRLCRNYYFIRNLVLDSKTEHQINKPQRNSLQRYNSQQKFTIRKISPAIPNLRYLQSTKLSLGHKKQQPQLPHSLKTTKINYFSCHEPNPKPKLKKERSKKSILIPPRKLLRKSLKEVQYQIGRWEDLNGSGGGIGGNVNMWEM